MVQCRSSMGSALFRVDPADRVAEAIFIGRVAEGLGNKATTVCLHSWCRTTCVAGSHWSGPLARMDESGGTRVIHVCG